MEKKRRRKYSREFKEEAVKLVNEQGYGVSEVARDLGINVNVLGRWKREFTGSGVDSSSFNGESALQLELQHLRKENKRLQMEREILKKAAAFFANESD